MKLLLVDDDASLRKALGEVLRAEGFDVTEAASAGAAREAFSESAQFDAVLLDLMLPPTGTIEAGGALMRELLERKPRTKIVVVSGTGDTAFALKLVNEGAYDFLAKPVDPDVLVAVIRRVEARSLLEARVGELETALQRNGVGLIGECEVFRKAVAMAERVATADVPVLLTGESGTGKEVFARLIHERSRRAAKPFVAINCGALAASLLESTLFGHKRGAFTGAVSDAPGLFSEANGGTLFLDEIGDLDFSLQVKLLRALELGEVLPIGASKPIHIDVRIISATHQPLPERVSEEKFREDLYWRIRGVELALPSLAERAGDVPLLAQHFLTAAKALVPGSRLPKLSPGAIRALEQHSWPGNLRELKHEMQRALVLSGGRDEIFAEDFSPGVSAVSAKPSVAAVAGTLEEKIFALERSELTLAMTESKGNKTHAAQKLGLSRQGLLNKLARHGLA